MFEKILVFFKYTFIILLNLAAVFIGFGLAVDYQQKHSHSGSPFSLVEIAIFIIVICVFYIAFKVSKTNRNKPINYTEMSQEQLEELRKAYEKEEVQTKQAFSIMFLVGLFLIVYSVIKAFNA